MWGRGWGKRGGFCRGDGGWDEVEWGRGVLELGEIGAA